MPAYFRVIPPLSEPTPVVVEIPHASVRLEPQALATLEAPARSIGMDADLYVDKLYRRAPALGATVLVSQISRYVVDLNRSENDIDSATVEGAQSRSVPHGLIWRDTTEARPALSRRLARLEVERRLEVIYRPYHRALSALLEERRERFGFAILLAAHSMPSSGRAGHTDPGEARADVVPGTQGRTTAAAKVIAAVEAETARAGLSLKHDDPYRGGFTTLHYGRPQAGIHAIQIELARRLYMNEQTLEPHQTGFAQTARFCSRLVRALGALERP